jgi:hypothetical protein
VTAREEVVEETGDPGVVVEPAVLLVGAQR